MNWRFSSSAFFFSSYPPDSLLFFGCFWGIKSSLFILFELEMRRLTRDNVVANSRWTGWDPPDWPRPHPNTHIHTHTHTHTHTQTAALSGDSLGRAETICWPQIWTKTSSCWTVITRICVCVCVCVCVNSAPFDWLFDCRLPIDWFIDFRTTD